MTSSKSFDNLFVIYYTKEDSISALLRPELNSFGFCRVDRVIELNQLLKKVSLDRPDLILLSLAELGPKVITILSTLKRTMPCPLVIFAETDAPKVIERAIELGVSAFVVDEIQPRRLQSVITVAMTRYRQNRQLLDELEATKQALEDRKVIEKAKGFLMQQNSLSEEQAHKALGKLAMNKGETIIKTAQMIVDILNIQQK